MFKNGRFRQGKKLILLTLLAILPAVIFWGIKILDVAEGKISPMWVFAVYLGLIFAVKNAIDQSKVGDRHVIKNSVLYLHRGQKLISVIHRKQIRNVTLLGNKMILSAGHDQMLAFVKGNYEVETWLGLHAAHRELSTSSSLGCQGVKG